MKKFSLIAIVSLLLVIVLSLASCDKDKTADKGYDPEVAVTVDAVLENFIKFDTSKDSFGPSGSGSLLNDSYGSVYDDEDGYIVFYKETKDFMNNLTEEYTIYSIENREVIATLKNTYPDEFNGEDEYGNDYRQPKTLTVNVRNINGTVYFAATYTEYTRLSDEVIKDKEDQAGNWYGYDTYSKSTYTDFYDAEGNKFASSSVTEFGEFVDENSRYNAISFGKTVAIFNKIDSKLLKTYDGEKEKICLPDFSNEKYYYFLQVAKDYGVIEVYNFDGELVLSYDYTYVMGTGARAYVLDNGDILLQTMKNTDSLDYDVSLAELRYEVSTYLIDVETATAKEVDFGYFLVINDAEIYTKEDFTAMTKEEGIIATENVRNVAIAYKIDKETKTYSNKETTVFFDNLLNINFEYTGELAYGADRFDCTKLDDGYMLMHIENGATERAIFNQNGEFVCYVPDDAIVTEKYIVSGETIYDLKMSKVSELDVHWNGNYVQQPDYRGHFANHLVFTYTEMDMSDDGQLRRGVELVNLAEGYSNTRIVDARVVDIDENFLVLYDEENYRYDVYCKSVYNGFNRIASLDSIPEIEEYDNYFIIIGYIADERVAVEVSKVDYNEAKDPYYNPEYNPEKDPEYNPEDPEYDPEDPEYNPEKEGGENS